MNNNYRSNVISLLIIDLKLLYSNHYSCGALRALIFPTFLPISLEHATFVVLIYDVTERVIQHHYSRGRRVSFSYPLFLLTLLLRHPRTRDFLGARPFFRPFLRAQVDCNYRCAEVSSKGEEQRRQKQPERRNNAAAFSNARKIRAAQSHSLSYSIPLAAI